MTTFLSNTPFIIQSGSFNVGMDSIPGYSELYPTNLIADGNMEVVGVGSWTVGAGTPTLSKETADPHGGTQSLRLTYNGVAAPNTYQPILTVGDWYHAVGWGHGDGTYVPSMGDWVNAGLWTGTSSTSWQNFTVDWQAGHARCYFATSAAAAAAFGEFDDIVVQRYKKDVKVIECVTAGVLYMPSSSLHQTPTDSAYGTWEWWQNKVDAGQIWVGFGSEEDPNTAGNYAIVSETDEKLKISKPGVATLLNAGVVLTTGTWEKITLTRSRLGLFELFLDDVSQGTATDTAITSADYLGIRMKAGDKIAYSDLKGGHSIRKGLFG